MKSFKLFINTSAVCDRIAHRKIRLAPAEPDEITPAQKTAEKMIRSCRENVNFLNWHLDRFNGFISLPPLLDNVLYLAYSIKVKDGAPFTAAQMRTFLDTNGIETETDFRFIHQPGADPDNSERATGTPGHDLNKAGCLCVPCHMGLTIVDLQRMITTFERFFEPFQRNNYRFTNRESE